ncbi:MAG: leucine-rich repeat protein [Butyrivibrio sp.]|nr:leucine-rich repeat protein [Butyrivibrio sp.]
MREYISANFKDNKKLIAIVGAFLIALIIILMFFLRLGKLQGVEIRIQRLVGTVKLFNEKGDNLTLIEKMRLNTGNRVTTAEKSLVMMSIDETKLITMEAKSDARITSAGKNLEFSLEEGTLFFNVTKKLEADATFDIRTSDMICSIRGTSGYSGKDNAGHDIIMVTDGTVEVEATNPVTGETITGTCHEGELLTVYLDDEAEGDATISFKAKKFEAEDIPPLALDAIRKDKELIARISKATGISEETIVALAEATSRKGQSMYGTAIEELKKTGIEDAVPLMGQEAWDMVDVANQAADIAGTDFDVEIAMIEGTRKVQDTGVETGCSEEETSKLVKKSAECIGNSLKLAKDEGLESGALIQVSEAVSDTLAASVEKMEMAELSSEEIEDVMNAIIEVYSGTIDVAARESDENGTDKPEAITLAVDSASAFVEDIVSAKMAMAASGDETVLALLGFSDNEDGDTEDLTVAQQVLGQQRETLVVVADNTGRGVVPVVGNEPQAVVTPVAATGNAVTVGTVNNSSEGSVSGGSSDSTSGGNSESASGGGSDNSSDGGNVSEGNGGSAGSDDASGSGSSGASTGNNESAENIGSGSTGNNESAGNIGSGSTGNNESAGNNQSTETTETTYDITVEQATGGTVTTYVGGNQSSKAASGETVSLGFSIDSGYRITDIKVVSNSGNEEVVTVAGNTATFQMPAEAVTVKATYEAQTYTVTLNTNGGVINGETLSSYKYGVGATLPTQVSKDQTAEKTYSFAGWYTGETDGNRVTSIGAEATGDKTYYAHWTEAARKYSVDLAATEDGLVNFTVDGNYDNVAPVGSTVTISALDGSASTFIEWQDMYGNAGIGGTSNERTLSFTMPAGDVSVKALFEKKYFSVDINPMNNGTITASPEGGYEGDTITLTINPKEGYELDVISVVGAENTLSGSGNTWTFKMPAFVAAVSADFKLKDYMIEQQIPEFFSVTVKVDGITGKTTAHKGDPVSVTIVSDDDAYKPDTLTVMGLGGTEVATNQGTQENVYTFRMPSEPVTIMATAVKVPFDINFNGVGSNGNVKAYLEGSSQEIREARFRDSVVLDIEPEQFYELETLEVKKANGDIVASASQGDTSLTFSMPAEKVNVSAKFKKAKGTLHWDGLRADAVNSNSITVKAGQTNVSSGAAIEAGTDVEVSFTRSSGYTVSGVELLDENGNVLNTYVTFEVDGETSGYTKYKATFEMPGQYVNIKAVEGNNKFIVNMGEYGDSFKLSLQDNTCRVDETCSFSILKDGFYEIQKVTYKRGTSGQEVELIPDNDFKYSFIMPPDDVIISVGYVVSDVGLSNGYNSFAWTELIDLGLIKVHDDTLTYVANDERMAGELYVPDVITRVGDKAALGSPIRRVVFLGTVTSVGSYAFSGCEQLEAGIDYLPSADIGEGAFEGCSSLKFNDLPCFENYIGPRAFKDCTSLETVELITSRSDIPEGMFEGCTNLKNVTGLNYIMTIGASAFKDTAIESVQLRENLISIGENAFNCDHSVDAYYGGVQPQWEDDVDVEGGNDSLVMHYAAYKITIQNSGNATALVYGNDDNSIIYNNETFYYVGSTIEIDAPYERSGFTLLMLKYKPESETDYTAFDISEDKDTYEFTMPDEPVEVVAAYSHY